MTLNEPGSQPRSLDSSYTPSDSSAYTRKSETPTQVATPLVWIALVYLRSHSILNSFHALSASGTTTLTDSEWQHFSWGCRTLGTDLMLHQRLVTGRLTCNRKQALGLDECNPGGGGKKMLWNPFDSLYSFVTVWGVSEVSFYLPLKLRSEFLLAATWVSLSSSKSQSLPKPHGVLAYVRNAVIYEKRKPKNFYAFLRQYLG